MVTIKTFAGPPYTGTDVRPWVDVRKYGATGNGTTNDQAAIAAAIAALPANGGTVFFPPGTYRIATTLNQPDKPVKIEGCGDASVIDLTSATIAALTLGYNRTLHVEGIKIKGNGSVGQIAVSIANAVNAAIPMTFTGVSVENIEKVFVVGASSYSGVTCTNFNVTFAARTTSQFWSGGSGAVVLHNVTATNDGAAYRGGISGDPYVWASDCNLGFTSSVASSVSAMWASASAFIGSFTITSVRSCIMGCNHSAYSVARRIDLAAGASYTVIKGCQFNDWTSEAVRVAASNCVIEGNRNCKIAETGTPTGNLYANNDGISGSTLLGANSRIGPENYRNVMDFGAKGDGTTNDQAAIAAAIAALPADGGVLFFPPGDFRITSTLTLPNKPIMVKGSGSTSTKITIGTNAIDVFTLAQTQIYVFEDFEVQGDGSTSNQNFIKITGNYPTIKINRVDIDWTDWGSSALYDGIKKTGGTGADVYITDSVWMVKNYIIDGSMDVHLERCTFYEWCGIENGPHVYAKDCLFSFAYGCDVAESEFIRCTFAFFNNSGAIVVTGIEFADTIQTIFLQCGFDTSGTVTRYVDITNNHKVTMTGCAFGPTVGSECVRTAATYGRYTDNVYFKITETGSADYNYFRGNTEFDGSTLIGSNSRVNGIQVGISTAIVENIGKANFNLTAVGNVGTGEDNLQTYSLPARSLYKTGSAVRIKAWGTTANNANAKTVKMYFGTQVVITTSLTISQAGIWRIEAVVAKTGSNTQKYIADLLETWGMSESHDVEQGTAAQTDTNAITIKCTGEGTDNNDIVQEGMLVEVMN